MSFNNTPVYMESVSAVTATPSVEVGCKRDEGGNEYMYVYNAGGTQISPGLGVIMSGNAGYSCTVSSLTGVGGFLGVVKHTTLTTATYGWVIVRGFAPVRAVANTAIVAGGVLVPGDNGTFAPATGAQSAVIQGFVVTATASGGLGSAYVKCFG